MDLVKNYIVTATKLLLGKAIAANDRLMQLTV